jgi:diguanylate cyclase (GGDEF)-like protein
MAFRSSKSDLPHPSGRAAKSSKPVLAEERYEPRSPLPAQPQPNVVAHAGKNAPAPDSPDPRQILDSIGQAVYDWDLHSDHISWGPNAASVLGIALDAIRTGRGFAECLSHDSESSRHDAILRAIAIDAGMGASFQICYGLTPPDCPRDATVWVEDSGRWFAGPDGRPSRAHGLVRVMTDGAKQERQLSFRSRSDSLTGALNRVNLLEETTLFFAQATKCKHSFAALLIGLDDLPLLNRAYGYDVADQVIAEIANRLRGNSREGDLVARYASNKLALALHDCDKLELTVAAERLIDAAAATSVETSAGPVRASLRVGGVVAPLHARAAHALFQNAETALDLTRRPGAPRLVIYEPSLAREETRLRAVKVSDEIVSALHDRRIMIALQPLVHAATGVPALHEALMRLRRADGALALPAAILPTAEKSGLIQMIDQRVLDLGLKKLREDPDMRIAVNVSGHTLHDPDFFIRLSATLESCRGIARRLTIELTETCVIDDIDVTARAIGMIRKLGAKVAMDDFGAGHTSFKTLRRCEFDLVKIDGAFIQNLARSSDDRFFVRTLIELARHIGVPMVAEWVEDEATAKILRDWGVEYLQGDYFGPAAVPASDLRAFGA